MIFPSFNTPVTGIVVPVSALRSRESAGIGEFPDLVYLARWAAGLGIRLIQILPVNDTGFERSPYSALSAFALHPIYARLDDFPEASEGSAADSVAAGITRLRETHGKAKHVDFEAILASKLELLKTMWKSASKASLKAAEEWAGENPWVKSYALFSLLKEENHLDSWLQWDDNRNPKDKDLTRLWKKKKGNAGFWIWMQWRLEEQFRSIAEQLDSLGVALKGDIPILINDDSADVWADRQNFHLDKRAGAPPDAGSPGGQNWGFPTYDWNYLQQTKYRWWRDRLAQASKFYHAYRIDHVLGFFRIWAVPENDISALGGYFEPSAPITTSDLNALGFDDDRITWLSRSHFPGDETRRIFGEEWETAVGMLEQVELEDLWREGRSHPTEKEVAASTLSDKAKESLMVGLRNRTLIQIGWDHYAPSWNFEGSRGWQSLSDGERMALGELVQRRVSESEALWEETGRRLLGMMKTDGSMLVCAEDLGSVPSCVPSVLDELGILGLKVLRWARQWDLPGQPYIPFSDYPVLSVATGSVHDSTTVRGWLSEEAQSDAELRQVMGLPRDADLSGIAGNRQVLEKIQESNSLIAIHPLQDLLALESTCVSQNPNEERINVPGTVEPTNWCWRMIPYVEQLTEHAVLNDSIRALCALRETTNANFPGGQE